MGSDQLCLILVRWLHLVACALLVGSLLVRGWIAPDAPAVSAAVLGRLIRRAGVSALLTGVLWLLLQARDMADGADYLPALRDVLWLTRFGQAFLARTALLLLALTVAGRGWAMRARNGSVFAALAVATLAATGHGAAAGDTVLMLALVVHVLGASAWLGGLLPLGLVLRSAEPVAATAAARRFSRLGAACVLAVLGGAVLQWPLIGSAAALVGTAYGTVVTLKTALLCLLLGLAAANLRAISYRPATAAANPMSPVRLRVWMELSVGVSVFAAASWLLQLVPAAHREIEWPLDFRPSIAALSNAGLRLEAVMAGIGLLAALALAAFAVAGRRIRLPALALGAAAMLWSAPSVAILLAPAYPTSFHRSPTGFSAASVIAGAALYPAHCAMCHGTDGRGDGPLASRSSVPPADLTAPHLWDHLDGELFWWLSAGMTDWRGQQVMPGFKAVLDEDQRWALIDFVRARNAGLRVPASGANPADVERQILRLRLRSRSSIGVAHAHRP